jgi:hypothetical protein
MTFVCQVLDTASNVCLQWVEQQTLHELYGITIGQSSQISLAISLLIIICAVFNKLSQIGDKSHD